MESYNECISRLLNIMYTPQRTQDSRVSFQNTSLSNNNNQSSAMIFIETNTDNIKSQRPDVFGWCISLTGKLRTLDQSTSENAKKNLLKFREHLGSLAEIKSF